MHSRRTMMRRAIAGGRGGLLLRDPFVLAGLLLYASLAVALAAPLEPATGVAALRWVGPLFLALLLAGAVWSGPFGSRAERTFWRAIGVSWLVWSVAIVVSIVTSLSGLHAGVAIEAIATISYVAYVVGVECTPHRHREERVRSLEGLLAWALTAALGVGLLVYFVVIPGLQEGNRVEAAFILSVGFECYLAFRLLQLCLLAGPSRWRWLYGLLAASAVGFAVADLLVSTLASGADLAIDSGPGAVVWLVPYLPALVAARARLLPEAEPIDRESEEEPLAGPREQLLLLAILFPSIHLVGYGTGLLDPAYRLPRDLLVAAWLVVLGGVAATLFRRASRRAHRAVVEAVRARAIAREQEEKLALYADLEAMKDRYETIFHTSPDAVSLTRVEDGRFLDVNEAFEEMTGYHRSEVVGRTREEIGMIDSPSRVEAEEVLSRDGRLQNYQARIVRRDGGTAVGLVSTQPLEIDGEPCILAVSRDITELHRTQEALRGSEERFARSFFANPDPSVLTTLSDGRILEVNEAFCALSGYERGEVVGRTGPELGMWSEEHGREVHRRLVDGRGVRELEIDVWTREGERRTAMTSAVVVDLGDGTPCVLNVVQDVTERRQIERKLQQAQRLESVGTLAGGIAHNLNNVLTPVVMAVELLKRGGLAGADRLLSILETNTRRGADLVRQILALTRGTVERRVSVAPADLVRELEELMEETFPKGIELVVQAAADVPSLQGDPSELHQVLLNLCVNARDAMEGRGRLELRAYRQVLDEAACAGRPRAFPGVWVVFEVVDEGHGMDPEVAERIFDPFFTTKDVGKGTGLGLFSVRSSVHAHDGFLEVESEPGRGARFLVFLPCDERPDHREEEPERLRKLLEGRGETILLVDDEEAVREVAASVLRAFGYRVVTAGDGVEALALAGDGATRLDAAVVDLMMPRMDGAETIHELRRSLPKLPILAMSGSAENPRPPEGASGFLQKPFHANAMLEAVQELLRGESKAS